MGDSGLGDFGDLLLPRFVDRGKVYAHQLDGYWRDLGQPHHYLNAHLELLDAETRSCSARGLADPHPAAAARAGARCSTEPRISDSLLSSGCVVAGTVTRSVIGPGVVVEAGCRGRGERDLRATPWSVAGATVTRSIVDTGCELLEAARRWVTTSALDDPDAIPIVGRESRVSTSLKPGARLAPGTTA